METSATLFANRLGLGKIGIEVASVLWQGGRDLSRANNAQTRSNQDSRNPVILEPSANWVTLRQHTNTQELAIQARDYIRQLLGQEPPRSF